MSGPIIRKYGFPNFESIFGKRELQHGVDGPPPAPAEVSDEAAKSGTEPRPEPAERRLPAVDKAELIDG